VQRGLVAPLQAEREVELRRRLAQHPRLEAAVYYADATGAPLSPRSENELAQLVEAVMALPGPERVRATAAAVAAAPQRAPRASAISHHPRPVIAPLDSTVSSIQGAAALLGGATFYEFEDVDGAGEGSLAEGEGADTGFKIESQATDPEAAFAAAPTSRESPLAGL